MSDHHEEPLISALLEEEDDPEITSEPTGFLPIETNWFDRLFISIMIWIALSLFWFRVMEPVGLSIWISNAIAAALAFIIIRKG
jgi:predicted small integral membrane protein